MRNFMTEDPDDGRFYYDYVSCESVVVIAGADADLYGGYLAKIGTLVERGLAHPRTNVRKKYLWLHRRYVAALEVLAAVPPERVFRLENPGLCEWASVAPRFEDLAAAAFRSE